jgi:hypothetical protein
MFDFDAAWSRLTSRARSTERRAQFSCYYRINRWGNDESRSGNGSQRNSASVAAALSTLADICDAYAVRSVADIPCGDFNWIDQFVDARPEIDYRGFDIVPAMIRNNRAKAPHRRFEVLDIVAAVPPRMDLIFCKDLFNHLTYREVDAALANMRMSGSRYLLATNNFGYANANLPVLALKTSRYLDICAPPFAYRQPIWQRGYLGLWPLGDMIERNPGC